MESRKTGRQPAKTAVPVPASNFLVEYGLHVHAKLPYGSYQTMKARFM